MEYGNVEASIGAFGGALLMTGTAFADFSATTVTDLNVRSGPGPEFQVIGVIAANTTVPVQGCLDESKWCTVLQEAGISRTRCPSAFRTRA